MDVNKWVYSVVISRGKPRNATISYLEIVKEKNLYFHPIGTNGWPKEPPSYFGFRYDGKLQFIREVKNTIIISEPHDYIKEIPSQIWEPCYLHYLGKTIIPKKVIKNGGIYPSGRYWCKMDILLKANTISEAFYDSKIINE